SPGAVGELKEVSTGVGGAIEIGALDALSGDFRLFFRLRGRRGCARGGCEKDEAIASCHWLSTKKRRVYFAQKLYICAPWAWRTTSRGRSLTRCALAACCARSSRCARRPAPRSSCGPASG